MGEGRNKPLSLDETITAINKHEYDELTKYLESIDWFSIPRELIVPREKVRAFIKSIENEETRLNVARFLQKYEDYYFKEADNSFTANIGPDPIAEFHRELEFLMKQLTSNGEFSDDKFSKLQKRSEQLEKQVQDLQNQVTNLETQLDKYKHPSDYGKHIPDELNNNGFLNIMNHLVRLKVVRKVTEPDTMGVRRVTCFQWDASKALFGYFVGRMNEVLGLRGARVPYNWKIFEPVINNYDELIKEARKSLSAINNSTSTQAIRLEGVEKIDEALQYKDLPF